MGEGLLIAVKTGHNSLLLFRIISHMPENISDMCQVFLLDKTVVVFLESPRPRHTDFLMVTVTFKMTVQE